MLYLGMACHGSDRLGQEYHNAVTYLKIVAKQECSQQGSLPTPPARAGSGTSFSEVEEKNDR